MSVGWRLFSAESDDGVSVSTSFGVESGGGDGPLGSGNVARVAGGGVGSSGPRLSGSETKRGSVTDSESESSRTKFSVFELGPATGGGVLSVSISDPLVACGFKRGSPKTSDFTPDR